MSGLCDCPPATSSPPTARAVYRFVHADMADGRNFLPPAKLSPSRWVNRKPECSDFALSLFESVPQATRFYDELAKTFRKIRLTIGTHLAEVSVTPADGLATPVDTDGHFDLHEYASADLGSASTQIGPLGGPNG